MALNETILPLNAFVLYKEPILARKDTKRQWRTANRGGGDQWGGRGRGKTKASIDGRTDNAGVPEEGGGTGGETVRTGGVVLIRLCELVASLRIAYVFPRGGRGGTHHTSVWSGS